MNFEPAQEEEALHAQLRQVFDNATPHELETLAERWRALEKLDLGD